MDRNQFLFPSLILGAALVLTGVVVSGGVYRVKALSNTISVTGSAERMITSDVIKWTIQISHSVDTTGLPSGNAAMEQDLRALKGYLGKQGIAEEWLTVQPVTVETIVDYQRGGVPSGYTLRQSVLVESNDVATVKKAAEGVGVLINEGAFLSTLSVEYFVSTLGDLKQDILADATADARARAQRIVQAAGSNLGSLRSAGMGVLQVTARNSVEVSDYGIYDASVFEKKVTAVVRASFSIE